MDALRTQTRSDHDALDQLPYAQAMLSRPLPRHQHLSHVTAEAHIQHHLEELLAACEHPHVRAIWDGRRRAPLLKQDAQTLQSRTTAHPSPTAMRAARSFTERLSRWARDHPIALLGALYVMEGSTLGGVILRRHLTHHNPEDTDALSRFAPYPEGVGRAWKAFQARMNVLDLTTPEREHIIATARATFQAFQAIFTSLAEPRAAA